MRDDEFERWWKEFGGGWQERVCTDESVTLKQLAKEVWDAGIEAYVDDLDPRF